MKKNLNIQKNIIKLILILVCGITYGQTEIVGKVISGISEEKPISDIYVQELITKQPLIIADSLGHFRIEYLEPNKKYMLHKKDIKRANVGGLDGFRGTLIWEDKYEKAITDNYASVGVSNGEKYNLQQKFVIREM